MPLLEIIPRREVQKRCRNIASATLDRWERDGEFPQRVHIGPRTVGWFAHEVDAFLRRRGREREFQSTAVGHEEINDDVEQPNRDRPKIEELRDLGKLSSAAAHRRLDRHG